MSSINQLNKEVQKLKLSQRTTTNRLARVKKINKNIRPKNKSGKRRNRMRSGPRFSPALSKFIDCVTSPFTSSGAQVPDHWEGFSLVLKDYIAAKQLTMFSSSSDTGGEVSAIALFIVPGKMLQSSYYSSSYSNYDSSSTDYGYWHVGCVSVSGGTADPINDNNAYYGVPVSATEPEIFNTTSYNTSLAQGARIVSYGMRVWPVIETVTSSDTNAIATIYAGEMSLAQLFQDFVAFGGTERSIPDGIESNPNFKLYSNSEGCSVRFNTLQDGFLNFKTQYQWYNNPASFVDQYITPIIYITFTNPIVGVDQNNGSHMFTLPIYLDVVTWLEGQLQIPTPITQQRSPIDPGFAQVRNMVLANKAGFPTVVSGHSFKTLAKKMKQVTRFVSNFANRASKISTGIAKTANYVNGLL